ncbi:uncharacterized protein [Fopius arisanus]|uniref:Uncharacterized protein n=1 Tax=Fopius arisanus TaxID=64838 RepID=A0A9R1TCY7_9HYME|nr:PREDICTED: uncharacterized protein LOC105268791 [Fopius arisanus]
MTLKALLNWGGFGNFGKPQYTPVERWHGGYVGRGGHGSSWDHKAHGHGHYKKGGGKGGGGSAALSALTLLAFLFLLNVMQQSINDNNATVVTTTAATIFLRDVGSDLTAREEGITPKPRISREARDFDEYGDEPPPQETEKGDTFGFDPHPPCSR